MSSNLFSLDINKKTVKRIEITKDSISEVEKELLINIKKYKLNAINFDGFYKPEEDECLKIENFSLPNEIKRAIKNPLGEDKLIVENKEMNIRAVFLILDDEERERIIFQRTQKKQVLSKGIKFLWDKDTFILSRKPVIAITDRIDAYYEDGILYFKSYYWANQIISLDEYYREATDNEIRKFCNNSYFYVEDVNLLLNSSKFIRKKIAYIEDSKVLTKNTIGKIVANATKLGLDLKMHNDKIVFPTDLVEQKKILSYLADEIYKGVLSDDVYLTNSKRPLN